MSFTLACTNTVGVIIGSLALCGSLGPRVGLLSTGAFNMVTTSLWSMILTSKFIDIAWAAQLAKRVKKGEMIGKSLKGRKVKKKDQAWDDMIIKPGLANVLELEAELDNVKRKKLRYQKEVEMMTPWGDFSFELVNKLNL